MHHWQAIYRHAFYRGGPILTSALSGIEQALWDIKGKALGVPVYELLGGPTRDRVRVYAHVRNDPQALKQRKAQGFTAFKTGVQNATSSGIVASQQFVEEAAETFAALREAGGKDVDIGIDFHGAISPQNAKLLVKALEPYQPMFIEEPVQCQNVDAMAEIARGTHLPIATGERLFTKWAFREVLEKQAATILQPDLCHAGGIFEGPPDRRHGGGVLRGHRAAQSAGSDLAGGRDSTGRLNPQLHVPGAGLTRRRLLEAAVQGRKRPRDGPHRPGPGHRDRRGAARRRSSATTGPTARPTTPATAPWWIGKRAGQRTTALACQSAGSCGSSAASSAVTACFPRIVK